MECQFTSFHFYSFLIIIQFNLIQRTYLYIYCRVNEAAYQGGWRQNEFQSRPQWMIFVSCTPQRCSQANPTDLHLHRAIGLLLYTITKAFYHNIRYPNTLCFYTVFTQNMILRYRVANGRRQAGHFQGLRPNEKRTRTPASKKSGALPQWSTWAKGEALLKLKALWNVGG